MQFQGAGTSALIAGLENGLRYAACLHAGCARHGVSTGSPAEGGAEQQRKCERIRLGSCRLPNSANSLRRDAAAAAFETTRLLVELKARQDGQHRRLAGVGEVVRSGRARRRNVHLHKRRVRVQALDAVAALLDGQPAGAVAVGRVGPRAGRVAGLAADGSQRAAANGWIFKRAGFKTQAIGSGCEWRVRQGRV